MIRSILNGQRGGVATLISIGFLAFSIPLISGSLGLAEATSIDARVKTEKLSQSSGLLHLCPAHGDAAW